MNIIKDLDIEGVDILQNEPLSKRTTFGIGGHAKVFLNISTIDALKKVVIYLNTNSLPYMVIGDGTNLLVTDKDLDIVFIKLVGKFREIKYNAQCTMHNAQLKTTECKINDKLGLDVSIPLLPIPQNFRKLNFSGALGNENQHDGACDFQWSPLSKGEIDASNTEKSQAETSGAKFKGFEAVLNQEYTLSTFKCQGCDNFCDVSVFEINAQCTMHNAKLNDKAESRKQNDFASQNVIFFENHKSPRQSFQDCHPPFPSEIGGHI